MTLSIAGLDKAAVLAALYNAARPQGLGFLHYTPEPMSAFQAQMILDTRDDHYFDYLRGRVMKIDLATDLLETHLYNRDNGNNAAERVLDALRTGEATP